METISTQKAASLIHASNGKVFGVSFYKKGNKQGVGKNDLRQMRARLGSTVTKKDLAGGEAKYNPADHKLIWAYLMAGDENRTDAKNRRAISIEGITKLSIDGKEFAVSGQKHA